MELLENGYLTDTNYSEYCIGVCDKRCVADTDDLNDVLKSVGYIKRIFTDYQSTGVLKERLVLNYIITISNVFSQPHFCRILFYKINKKHHSVLKTCLEFLGLMPSVVDCLKNPIINDEIPIDEYAKSLLCAIK